MMNLKVLKLFILFYVYILSSTQLFGANCHYPSNTPFIDEQQFCQEIWNCQINGCISGQQDQFYRGAILDCNGKNTEQERQTCRNNIYNPPPSLFFHHG